jgi:hypothetical protein
MKNKFLNQPRASLRTGLSEVNQNVERNWEVIWVHSLVFLWSSSWMYQLEGPYPWYGKTDGPIGLEGCS